MRAAVVERGIALHRAAEELVHARDAVLARRWPLARLQAQRRAEPVVAGRRPGRVLFAELAEGDGRSPPAGCALRRPSPGRCEMPWRGWRRRTSRAGSGRRAQPAGTAPPPRRPARVRRAAPRRRPPARAAPRRRRRKRAQSTPAAAACAAPAHSRRRSRGARQRSSLRARQDARAAASACSSRGTNPPCARRRARCGRSGIFGEAQERVLQLLPAPLVEPLPRRGEDGRGHLRGGLDDRQRGRERQGAHGRRLRAVRSTATFSPFAALRGPRAPRSPARWRRSPPAASARRHARIASRTPRWTRPCSRRGKELRSLPVTSVQRSSASPPWGMADRRATRRRSCSCARKKGKGESRSDASLSARRRTPTASVSSYSAVSKPRGSPAVRARAVASASIAGFASSALPGYPGAQNHQRGCDQREHAAFYAKSALLCQREGSSHPNPLAHRFAARSHPRRLRGAGAAGGRSRRPHPVRGRPRPADRAERSRFRGHARVPADLPRFAVGAAGVRGRRSLGARQPHPRGRGRPRAAHRPSRQRLLGARRRPPGPARREAPISCGRSRRGRRSSASRDSSGSGSSRWWRTSTCTAAPSATRRSRAIDSRAACAPRRGRCGRWASRTSSPGSSSSPGRASVRYFPFFGLLVVGTALFLYRSVRIAARHSAGARGGGGAGGRGRGAARVHVHRRLGAGAAHGLVTTLATLVYLHSRFVDRPPEGVPVRRAPARRAPQQVPAGDRLQRRGGARVRGALGLQSAPSGRWGCGPPLGLAISWVVAFTALSRRSRRRCARRPGPSRIPAARLRPGRPGAARAHLAPRGGRWSGSLLLLGAAGAVALFGSRVGCRRCGVGSRLARLRRPVAAASTATWSSSARTCPDLNVARVWIHLPRAAVTDPEVLRAVSTGSSPGRGDPGRHGGDRPDHVPPPAALLLGSGRAAAGRPGAVRAGDSGSSSSSCSRSPGRAATSTSTSCANLNLTVLFRQGDAGGISRRFRATSRRPGRTSALRRLPGAQMRVVGEVGAPREGGSQPGSHAGAELRHHRPAHLRRLPLHLPQRDRPVAGDDPLALRHPRDVPDDAAARRLPERRDHPDRHHHPRHHRERSDPLLPPPPRTRRRSAGRSPAPRPAHLRPRDRLRHLHQRRRLPRPRLLQLPPLRQFGLVTSGAFILALLADFTALPAGLWIIDRWRNRGSPQP